MTRRTALFVTLCLPSTLLANDKGKEKGKSAGPSVDFEIVFGPDERRIIRDWVHDQPASGLPPGRAKRDRLPPGLEKRISPFPPAPERRLPPLGPDYERVFVHGRAAIVARIGRVVVDIFAP